MMNTQRLEKVLKKMETKGLEQMIISICDLLSDGSFY